MSNNLYITIYKKIEEEVLNLSSSIHFTDDQINVYSVDIADLIVRCSIEIESIVKDIYNSETKTILDSPGKCLKWMNEKWKISKKAISIISPHFHFNKAFPQLLCPLDYEKNSPEDFYKQYNAIKHNREKNINKANIYTLIRVLGALYILNLYYYNEIIYLENDRFATKIDKKKFSQIFTFYIAPCPNTIVLTSQKTVDPVNCIYRIERKDSYYAFKIRYKNYYDEIRSIEVGKPDNNFQQYVKSILGKSISTDDLLACISKEPNTSFEEIRNFLLNSDEIQRIISITAIKTKASYRCTLNKEA